MSFKNGTLAYAGDDSIDVYDKGSWTYSKYRTVTFSTAPSGDLLTWLLANGKRAYNVTLTDSAVYGNYTIKVCDGNSSSATAIATLPPVTGITLRCTSGFLYFYYTSGGSAFGVDLKNATGGVTIENSGSLVSVIGDGTLTVDYWTCLAGDTLISLADGSQKRIDEIQLADKVLAYNPETLMLEADEIIGCDSNADKWHTEYDIWTFSDGTVVKTVHRHRFYNVERQAMIYMDEWNIGEHTIKQDGSQVALVKHENIKEKIQHYTIFTKNQNYFANGLLSGNRYTKPMHLN